MRNKFWLLVALAVVAVWYAFVFAGPRHVYVEVAPEAVERVMGDFSRQADDARAAGRPVTGDRLRKLAKSWDVGGCGPGYDILVVTDGSQHWVLTAMPRAPRVNKTTWIESVLYLRDTTELWPMLTVRYDEPGYHTDGGQSLAIASVACDTTSIQVHRRVEPAPLGENTRLTMRYADDVSAIVP